MNVLFSEGSSTSARQSLSALGPLGHTIDICDPQPLCIARFSRYVRAWHRCPPFALQPKEYLCFVARQLRGGRYDVLLPVHDQVLLLSRYREDLRRLAGLAVPDFEAVRIVQSKVRFVELLRQLGLPQPECRIVDSPADLAVHDAFPCYVKREFGTAGRGVWLVENPEQMGRLIARLAAEHGEDHRLLVQQRAVGEYCVVQSVFQQGKLVAAHCYMRRAQGVGGSAHARESVLHPLVVAHVASLGDALDWHGALHLEYFFHEETGQPQYIEANPRIGETMNATLAGTNLCEVLLQVSLDQQVAPLRPSRPGLRTHSILMSLLGAAERGASRRELWTEMWRAWRMQGVYAKGREELTRLDDDPLSIIPLAAVAIRLLARPAVARQIIRGAVDEYSLSDDAVDRVMDLPSDCLREICQGNRALSGRPAR